MSEKIWKFYAAPMSYFSGKVRPALAYKKIQYAEIWPTREVQKEIRAKTGVQFIPVIETDTGEVLQDSPRMFERIEAMVPWPPIFPEDPALRVVAEIVQDFCDDILVPQALHWRWSYPEQRQWVEEDWTSAMGAIAPKLAAQVSSAIPLFGVTDKTRAAIEEWFGRFLDMLGAHFESSRFLLGDVVTIADYALFGPMFAHFARDPVPARLIRERAPVVMTWLHEVTAAAPPAPWAGPPEVRDTLLPILREAGRTFVPSILAVGDFVAEALAAIPAGEDAPRILGLIEQDLFGVAEQRLASPYAVWRHARTVSRFAGLAHAERALVEEMLGSTGLVEYLETMPKARLAMDRFQLKVAA